MRLELERVERLAALQRLVVVEGRIQHSLGPGRRRSKVQFGGVEDVDVDMGGEENGGLNVGDGKEGQVYDDMGLEDDTVETAR